VTRVVSSLTKRSPIALRQQGSESVRISWDGRRRAMDNIFVERLWRSVKYEEVYLKDYDSVSEAINGIDRYFKFYNTQRLHQSLGYRTPQQVFEDR
jgi:putative transposase